jgi:hypothetical protein
MSTPARVGKNEWRAALKAARNANAEMRAVTKRIWRESSSPLLQALAGQLALSLSDNDQALNRLEEIARNTDKKQPA